VVAASIFHRLPVAAASQEQFARVLEHGVERHALGEKELVGVAPERDIILDNPPIEGLTPRVCGKKNHRWRT